MLINRYSTFLALVTAANLYAQPDAPTSADIPCQENAGQDAASTQPDSEGFISLFDGASFKGWWHNCKSEDSGPNRQQGGVWRVDTAEHALYSNQRGLGEGSLLLTNKKYGNQEIILDYWPEWKNDAGVFHRTNDAGASFQTIIDY